MVTTEGILKSHLLERGHMQGGGGGLSGRGGHMQGGEVAAVQTCQYGNNTGAVYNFTLSAYNTREGS